LDLAWVLYQILLSYPRFGRANAIEPLARLHLRPYGLAFWELGLCDSDLVLINYASSLLPTKGVLQIAQFSLLKGDRQR